MKSLAIEGLCFSGKSTLADRIINRIGRSKCVLLRDYSDFIAPIERPRVPASSPSEEWDSFKFYLGVDTLRWASISVAESDPRLVIQDRCFHTLVAHVFADDVIPSMTALSEAVNILDSWVRFRKPDFVLYLDADLEVLLERYRQIPNTLPPLFKERKYMLRFKDYFEHHYFGTRESLFFINARGSVSDVEELVIQCLNGLGLGC